MEKTANNEFRHHNKFQLQNWESFCSHIGDCHGTWSVYNLQGELIH
ncbi:DUF3598 family protein [Nostoc sp.]